MIVLQQLSNTIEPLKITAVIDTALCVGAGGSAGSLADKPIVRNAEDNLIIPASQLKGRLRHECEKLVKGLKWDICQSPKAETMCPKRDGLLGHFERDEYQVPGYEQHHCLICQLFGNPSLPSRILLDDLICMEDPINLAEVLRPGVTLNRRRRTSEEKKLYLLETSPVNAQLTFEGHIYLQPNWKLDRPDFAKALLWAGLRHIQALGGSKSTGLGWLHWELPEIQIDRTVWDFLAKGEVDEKNSTAN